MKNNGGPAFPNVNDMGYGDLGMSLRDYFAAKAPNPPKWWIESYGKNLNDLQSEGELIATWNYAYADAMLKAREEK